MTEGGPEARSPLSRPHLSIQETEISPAGQRKDRESQRRSFQEKVWGCHQFRMRRLTFGVSVPRRLTSLRPRSSGVGGGGGARAGLAGRPRAGADSGPECPCPRSSQAVRPRPAVSLSCRPRWFSGDRLEQVVPCQVARTDSILPWPRGLRTSDLCVSGLPWPPLAPGGPWGDLGLRLDRSVG